MSIIPKKLSKDALLGYLLVLAVPYAVGYLQAKGLYSTADALQQATADGGLTWKEILSILSTLIGAGVLHNADNGK